MPLPLLLIPLWGVLVEWGTGALAAYGLARLFSDESVASLVTKVEAWAVERVAHYSGLQLNPDDPFSDASMAGALSERVGFPIRSLKDKDMIKEDLDSYAVSLIAAKSGYNIRSVTNVATLKEDFLQIGTAELTARLGIPAGVMPAPGATFDAVAVKENLLTWAKAELTTRMEGEIQTYVTELSSAGAVVALAEQLNGKLADIGSKERVTARQVAVQVANRMATSAVVDYQKVAVVSDSRSRRRESLKAAQRKFREAHGNRQKYVPLGMNATIG